MARPDTDVLLTLIDAAYGCTSSDLGWEYFLREWGKQFPCLKSAITSYDTNFSRLNFGIAESFDPAFMELYETVYYKLNPWQHIVENLPAPPNTAWVHDYLPTEDLKRTQFYNEWIRPQDDVATGFGVMLAKSRDRFLNLSANLSFDHMDEGQTAADYMRLLGPHLQRAAELHRRLEGMTFHAGMLETVLDSLKTAIFLVDPQFKVHFNNKKAENLVRQGLVIKLNLNQRLQFISQSDQDKVRLQLCQSDRTSRSIPPLYVRLSEPADRPFVAFVSEIKNEPDRLYQTGPRGRFLPPRRFLLFLIDPNETVLAKQEAIIAVLGVTPAEARLAQGLMRGEALREYAAKARISYNTARSQLQSVLAKTDARNQTDLVLKMTKMFNI